MSYPRVIQWVHFLLATPIQFIYGAGFYRASNYAVKKGCASMELLVALSTYIAYFPESLLFVSAVW